MWRIPHVKPGAYRRARDALHACVTPLLRCCFVGLFCGVLSALSPVVGSCAATVASYGVVITASRLAPAAHGPDCRQATILGVVCAMAILVSPLAGMGAACFLAVCPTSCLWWPPKPKASMTVHVRMQLGRERKPVFFVRMQFGKGSERKELCGPRHVTEEAAKRDKESLDGKPIDEQLAGVASLDLLSHATQAEVRSQVSAAIKARRERQRDARSRHARREAESSSARAARLLKRRRAWSKARRNETAEQKLLRNAAERVRQRRCRNA